MTRDDKHFRLRMPDEIKDWVRKAADSSRRSMTAQILVILEDAMKNEKAGEAA